MNRMKFILPVLSVFAALYGLFHYLKNDEINMCDMTYMFEYPEYLVCYIICSYSISSSKCCFLARLSIEKTRKEWDRCVRLPSLAVLCSKFLARKPRFRRLVRLKVRNSNKKKLNNWNYGRKKNALTVQRVKTTLKKFVKMTKNCQIWQAHLYQECLKK